MDEHDRWLTLAAARLDFPLSDVEHDALERHLATCADCTRQVRAMRADATALAGMERRGTPDRVRLAVVRAATDPRGPRRAPDLRWSALAAALAVVLVAGALVGGLLLDRSRRGTPGASQPMTAMTSVPATDAATPRVTDEPRPTDEPRATDKPRATDAARTQTPRTPTPPPSAGTGWQDLGTLEALRGATIQLVLPRPDGGSVAIGRDASSTLPSVWSSSDGVTWQEVPQPDDVFGGRVPTQGVLHDQRLWVVGWDVSVESGGQRAIWSSPDGSTWTRVSDASGLLGTQVADVRITAGPGGLMAWTPAGRAWLSATGSRWTRADVGASGLTDAAVSDAAWLVVGMSDGRALVARSTDGRSWSEPDRRSASGDPVVGIESDEDGTLLAWIGTRPFDVDDGTWRPLSSASDVPDVEAAEDVLGGRGFLALQGAGTDGQQLASTSDGTAAWRSQRSEPVDTGARTTVGAAVDGRSWFVLTRQGTTYRGWTVTP